MSGPNEKSPSTWITALIRFGYLIKGFLYLGLGWFAFQAAFHGFQETGTKGVLEQIMSQDGYGIFLLGIVAAGLAFYALWKLFSAFKDFKDASSVWKKAFTVVANIVLGIIYGGLSYAAVQMLLGNGGSGSGTKKELVSNVLSMPFGFWLVLAAGSGILLFAGYEFYLMATQKFKSKFDTTDMSQGERTAMILTGAMGHCVRGVIHGLIGIFLIRAALTYDPDKAGGLKEALNTLAAQPYGPWILAITAIGLAAYGLFSMLLGWYRRITI